VILRRKLPASSLSVPTDVAVTAVNAHDGSINHLSSVIVAPERVERRIVPATRLDKPFAIATTARRRAITQLIFSFVTLIALKLFNAKRDENGNRDKGQYFPSVHGGKNPVLKVSEFLIELIVDCGSLAHSEMLHHCRNSMRRF
jgi:hypothetical protein